MPAYKLNFFLWPFVFLVLGILAGLGFSAFSAKKGNTGTRATAKTPRLHQHSAIWSNRKNNLLIHTEATDDYLKNLVIRLQKGELPSDWKTEVIKILDLAKNDKETQSLLILFFTKWAEKDLEAAIKASEELGIYSVVVKREIYSQLVTEEPEAAAAYLEEQTDIAPFYKDLINLMVKNMTINSPETAWNWCSSHKDYFEDFFKGLVDLGDARQVNEYLDKIRSETKDTPYLFIEYWASKAPEDVMKWLETTKDNSNHISYKMMAICGIANKDMKKAEQMIASLQPIEKRLPVFVISDKLRAGQDEETALSWILNQVPLSQIKTQSYLSPLAYWTGDFPQEAGAWVEKIPQSAARDTAVAIYAHNVSDADCFDKTVKLINSMGNSDQKEKLLLTTMKSWQSKYPDEFQRWRKTSSLSPQIKTSPTPSR